MVLISSHRMVKQRTRGPAPALASPDPGGVELPGLMTADRWKSAKMPARYTERQAADRGAVAKYYQETE